MPTKTRRRRAGGENCGCSGGYKYTNSKKGSRSAKGSKRVLRKRKTRKRKRKRTRKRRRR